MGKLGEPTPAAPPPAVRVEETQDAFEEAREILDSLDDALVSV